MRILVATRKIRNESNGLMELNKLTTEDFGDDFRITFKQTKQVKEGIYGIHGSDREISMKKFAIVVKNEMVNYLGSNYCPILKFTQVDTELNKKIDGIIREINERKRLMNDELELYRMEREMDMDYDHDF